MDGAGFRSLIIFLLLAIFAFVAGSLASENVAGALFPAVLVVGIFFLIYLGKNCWILLFIAPVVLPVVPLPSLQGYPLADVICAIVLCYMIVLHVTGYVHIKWNGILAMDVVSLILCIYMAASWVRNPVTVRAFTSITDYGDVQVGGKEYLFFIGAVFSYVAVSVVQVKLESLLKVLKWAFWLTILVCSYTTLRGFLGGTIVLGDEVVNSRFGAFVPIAKPLYCYLLSKYSLMSIFLTPGKLILIVTALGAILLGGYRTYLVDAAFFVYTVSIFHRQLIMLIVLTLISWGGVVYLSQQEGVFDNMPYGIKRTMTVIPGVEFADKDLYSDVNSSSDWRVEMWKWALDPSKGYIDDYVWGDGYGLSYHNMQWQGVLVGLNLRQVGDNELFAEAGSWHNTAISVLHHLGLVGLTLTTMWYFVAIWLIYQVCRALKYSENKEYVYVILCPIVAGFFTFWFLPGEISKVFSTFSQVAMVKLMYIQLRSRFEIVPLFCKKIYIPDMVRFSAHT